MRKMAAGLLLVLATRAPAQGPPLFMGDGAGPAELEVGLLAPERRGGTYQDYGARLQFPVHTSEESVWALQQRYARFNPDGIPGLPDDLTTLQAGVSHRRVLGGGRYAGLRVMTGSASDKPFDTFREVSIELTAGYQRPARGDAAWLFFLSYSNTRHFLNHITLPGIAYYKPVLEGKMHVLVGFPYMYFFYMPTERIDARLVIFGPRQMTLNAGWRAGAAARWYTEFDWSSQDWFPADRSEPDNRLFFDRKRLALGLQTGLSDALRLDLSAGREFHRRFFIARSSDNEDVPRSVIPAAWYGGAKLSLRL